MKFSLLFFIALASVIADRPARSLSTTDALAKYSEDLRDQSFLVYLEVREEPIKWFDSIPESKIKTALHRTDFVMHAQPGEYFVFQLGVWALRNVYPVFAGLTRPSE
jgi:hypothetical protein